MANKAKRRFVGLDTGEVSLVDDAAVEVDFAVIKNQGPQGEAEMTTAAAAATTEPPVTVPVDIEGSGEAVAKAMEHVRGIVDDIKSIVTAKAADDATTTPPADAAPAADADATEEPTVKSILSAAGLKDDALTAAVATLKEKGVDADKPLAAAAKVEKEAGEPAADAAAVSDDDVPLTMATLSEAVAKAAVFTPKRIAQIASVQETLKLVMEAIGQGQTPATNTPKVLEHPNPNTTSAALAGVQKAAADAAADTASSQLVDTLKSLAEGLKITNERLTTIEKTRQGTNDVSDEPAGDGTDTKVEKKQNIWKGLL